MANEKINGTYLGEIEDKYKNTYSVTSTLKIGDGGAIKGQYEYKLMYKKCLLTPRTLQLSY